MMHRRRFLASLGALAVAGKAAPGILAKIKPAAAAPIIDDGLSDIVIYGCTSGGDWMVGEPVAILRSGRLVTNAIGHITAFDGRTITVDWARS